MDGHYAFKIYANSGNGDPLSAKELIFEAESENAILEMFNKFGQYLAKDSQSFAWGLASQEGQLRLRSRQMPNSAKAMFGAADTPLLAYRMPAEVGGQGAAIYLEANRLFERLQNDLEVLKGEDYQSYLSFINFLQTKFNTKLDEPSFKDDLKRTALWLAPQQGEINFILTAEHNGPVAAEDFAALVLAKSRGLAKKLHYLKDDQFLVIGNAAKDVAETLSFLNRPHNAFANRLGLNLDRYTDFVVFLDSQKLIEMARNLGLAEDSFNSEFWQGLSYLSEILPNFTIAFDYNAPVLQTDIAAKIEPVPKFKRSEVEKIFNRLSDEAVAKSRNQPAVRDANRYADLLILKDALARFTAATGKAPASLTELAPAYVNGVPRDPLTGEDYSYSNRRRDAAYFVIMETETETSLGAAGFYCLTSKRIYFTQNSCREE